MYDIVFVILHFNTINETNNCIVSIKNSLNKSIIKIIVVDNSSLNNSGQELINIYKNDNIVDIIKLNENIGFARGNNVGIEAALKYNPSFVCCLNNDTLLEQTDFLNILESEYKISNAAIIGPQIILKDGTLQESAFKLKESKEYIAMKDSIDAFLRHPIFSYLKFIVKNILYNKRTKNENENRLNERIVDVVLHGCCIVFTKTFFEKLVGFCNETFLYGEEELLYLSVKKEGLLSVYNPKLRIKHLEDAATDSLFNNKFKKQIFIKKHQSDSLSIIISELDKYSQMNR